MVEKIEQILDEHVRPYFHSHGGDISVEAYDSTLNLLVLKLHGQCSSCIMQNESMDFVINNVLQKHFPNIRVEVNSGVSSELLDFAKKILNKN